MENNPRTFKLPSPVRLALAIAVVLVMQLAFAQVPTHNIVLTENSSTNLTATYDGSTTGVTVTFQAPNQWVVTFPATVNLGSTGRNVDWIEPEFRVSQMR
jgi:hypothetical protein